MFPLSHMTVSFNCLKHLVKIWTSLQYIFTVFWALQKVGVLCKHARATSADAGAGKSVQSSNSPSTRMWLRCVSCHDTYLLCFKYEGRFRHTCEVKLFMYVLIIISNSVNCLHGIHSTTFICHNETKFIFICRFSHLWHLYWSAFTWIWIYG